VRIFGRRQRHLRVADRIAARVQERASKDLRKPQRETQRDPRSAGEPADVDTLRIHAKTLHDVVRSQQCQGFARSRMLASLPEFSALTKIRLRRSNTAAQPCGSIAFCHGGTNTSSP